MTGGSASDSIRHAITEHGPITFAEFMEVALYGPGGYYTSGSPISADGDYFTSPSAHPLFGALIAVQLHEMWQLLGSPEPFTVIEEGAGHGGLAADITEYVAVIDKQFATALRYVALDIAPPAQQHYPVSLITESPTGITGCLLSNELLDAMPVHRFEVSNGELHEIFISHDGEKLVEILQPPSTPIIEERLRPYLAYLPDGYRGEMNAGLDTWASRQAGTLDRGWALTIDYGFERPVLYRSDRTSGSLRTYYQHTLGQDPLKHTGDQDITAHVDFTAVEEAMDIAGFRICGFTTQAEFLVQLGIESALDQLRAAPSPRPAKRANELGARSLVDPEGMGGFRVAAYSRNVPESRLTGFGQHTQTAARQFSQPPLLSPRRHIALRGSQLSGSAHFEVQTLDELSSDRP